MLVIGEAIHVIAPKVKAAIAERDKEEIQSRALKQLEAGAQVLDLNIGPQRKTGPEVMTWIVDVVQEVAPGVRLSLDTTNAAAIEAGLQRCKEKPIINSTDATPERMSALMPLAAGYEADLIALTYAGGALPSSADARIELACERILPAAAEHGLPVERILFDPLVLTVNGNQDQAMQTIEAVRFFKQTSEPPPLTTCGLSNISSGAPEEVRRVLNRVFLVMMRAAGLDSAILDPLDAKLMEALRTVENRDDSTALGRLYLALFDAVAAGGEIDLSSADMSDPEQRDVVRTVEIFENKWIYAHSYLRA